MKKTIKKSRSQSIGQLSESDVAKGIGMSVVLGAAGALVLNGLWIAYKLGDESLDYERTLKAAATVDIMGGMVLLMVPVFMAMKR
jgi:uncharacterized membrane protein YeaQ/YmgE (transglycosylase-associated protein family)